MFLESFMNYTIVFSKYHSISEIGIVNIIRYILVKLILVDVVFNICYHSNYRIKIHTFSTTLGNSIMCTMYLECRQY